MDSCGGGAPGLHVGVGGRIYGTDAVTPIRMGTGPHREESKPAPASCRCRPARRLRRDDGGNAAGHVPQRFLLGIGPSGPQVIEGWHGLPYGKPLNARKNYIEIVRKVFAREARSRTAASITRFRMRVRTRAASASREEHSACERRPWIYTAAITPAGLRTAGEAADWREPFMMAPSVPASSPNRA